MVFSYNNKDEINSNTQIRGATLWPKVTVTKLTCVHLSDDTATGRETGCLGLQALLTLKARNLFLLQVYIDVFEFSPLIVLEVSVLCLAKISSVLN